MFVIIIHGLRETSHPDFLRLAPLSHVRTLWVLLPLGTITGVDDETSQMLSRLVLVGEVYVKFNKIKKENSFVECSIYVSKSKLSSPLTPSPSGLVIGVECGCHSLSQPRSWGLENFIVSFLLCRLIKPLHFSRLLVKPDCSHKNNIDHTFWSVTHLQSPGPPS